MIDDSLNLERAWFVTFTAAEKDKTDMKTTETQVYYISKNKPRCLQTIFLLADRGTKKINENNPLWFGTYLLYVRIHIHIAKNTNSQM